MGRSVSLQIQNYVAASQYDLQDVFPDGSALLYATAGHNGGVGNQSIGYLNYYDGTNSYRIKELRSLQSGGDLPDFFQSRVPLPLKIKKSTGETLRLRYNATTVSGGYVSLGFTKYPYFTGAFGAYVRTSTGGSTSIRGFSGNEAYVTFVVACGGSAGTSSFDLGFGPNLLRRFSSSTNVPDAEFFPRGIPVRTNDGFNLTIENESITGTGYVIVGYVSK